MPAKSFPTSQIRNVALVGHGGAGKTSLAEALLFTTGTIPRLGKVEDGNTVTDFDPEEARRRISVSLSLAPFETEGTKVNLLDTPGYADFIGDVAAALRAADLAVFVVSAVEGVEVQTEVAWRMAEELGLPRAIFVNKLDRERASFDRTLDALKAAFGAGVAPLQLPIGEEADFHGVIELLDDTAIHYDADGTGTTGPIPPELENTEHSVHDALVEGIVSPTTTSWSATSPTRPSSTEELAERARVGRGAGRGVPRAVRQRDQARRHRPARALHRARGARRPYRRPTATPVGVRVQDHRRPLRGAGEPVQGAPGHGEDRRDRS